MKKNYIISQYQGYYSTNTLIYHKDTHKLYKWTQYTPKYSEETTKFDSVEANRAYIEYIYDLENEAVATALTGSESRYYGEYLKYDYNRELGISDMSEEMRDEIFKYLREKYDAEYILPKCISSYSSEPEADVRKYRDDAPMYLWLYDLQTLSKYRDTGWESLYMICPRVAARKFNPKQWIKLTKPQRKMCINKFRELMSSTDNDVLPNNVKELLAVAEDNSFLLRKKANQGLPEVCKITRQDYDWVMRHKNDTPYGRRKSTTLKSYLKRYAKYLEYEYTRERDVTDLYWRHNRHWISIMQTERELVREAQQTKVDDLITDSYKDRVLPKLSIDGYDFEVTDDAKKWRKQAKQLHQCIVSMQYYKKSTSTIVLCTKDGMPYATFEVDADGKIIQSYKDEMSPDDMKPEAACTEACEKYIKEVGLISK